jgi:phosphopantetheine adenylyltransferase
VDISKSLWIDIIEEGYKAEWDRAMVNMNTYRNPPTIEERGKLVTDYLSSKEFHNWELYEDREIFPIGLSEEKQWVIVVGADTFKDHALYLPQHVNPIREKNNLPFMLSIVIPIQRDKDGRGYAVRRDDIK